MLLSFSIFNSHSRRRKYPWKRPLPSRCQTSRTPRLKAPAPSGECFERFGIQCLSRHSSSYIDIFPGFSLNISQPFLFLTIFRLTSIPLYISITALYAFSLFPLIVYDQSIQNVPLHRFSSTFLSPSIPLVYNSVDHSTHSPTPIAEFPAICDSIFCQYSHLHTFRVSVQRPIVAPPLNLSLPCVTGVSLSFFFIKYPTTFRPACQSLPYQSAPASTATSGSPPIIDEISIKMSSNNRLCYKIQSWYSQLSLHSQRGLLVYP